MGQALCCLIPSEQELTHLYSIAAVSISFSSATFLTHSIFFLFKTQKDRVHQLGRVFHTGCLMGHQPMGAPRRSGARLLSDPWPSLARALWEVAGRPSNLEWVASFGRSWSPFTGHHALFPDSPVSALLLGKL